MKRFSSLALTLFITANAATAAVLPLTQPLPATVPAGTQLNVADQDEVLQTLFNASGQIDRLSAKVHFGNFSDGPEILEAFRAGAVDVAVVGDAPPIQAQANGNDVLIVGVQRNSDREYQLAIAPEGQIRSLADLRGKRIANAPGTGREAYLYRVLEKAGLQPTEVKLVTLQTGTFTDAVRSNEVDAAALKEPNLTQYVNAYKDKGGTVLGTEVTAGGSTGLRYLYARRSAVEDPAKAAALREFVAHWVKGWQWANQHPAQWVTDYYVKNQGLTQSEGELINRVAGPTAFPRIDQALFAVQQHTADLLLKSGSIDHKVDAKAEFDSRFDAVIQQAAHAQ
ncbi:ABC transporter substrate-binding protein [Biostraticola tofi]|uniref:Sulfonate transport system substrate-binding protein n=1 Tax=Biostraticola tofi TaxID=466109 RepID=A0A4R3Z4U8_9GAMM|nr:ABC transporter substrate-binding protein [Biostraticola tofi]TCV98938.1 sulfonate transport system substrate-binding protein [Biostraticola tofi]